MGIHAYGKRSRDPQRELIRRIVPAIISPELWQQAQDALQQNFQWATRNSKHDYLLRGLLKRAFCG
jgi:site-specific DNA recombinase